MSTTRKQSPTFIDLFAGCGGLSLGLMQAGWQGLFAIEKDPIAFHTLFYNLILGRAKGCRFAWPEWFPPYPVDVRAFRRRFLRQIRALRGRVDLIAGGPPCQGFSFAGERNKNDPRNRLFRAYIDIVSEIRPTFVLIENVPGIRVPHGNGSKKNRSGRPVKAYATKVIEALQRKGYHVYEPKEIRARDFAVPQQRPRVFIVAARKAAHPKRLPDPFDLLEKLREPFLRMKGLPVSAPVSVRSAISDLERAHGKAVCKDLESPNGFNEGIIGPAVTLYQRLMRRGSTNGNTSGHRFARHGETTRARFSYIIKNCRPGVQLSKNELKSFGLRKTSLVPLAADEPAHTLTTLPDDVLHYREPRILTVREYGRLQSFPDWFDFRGKFTTGGDRRCRECPRYTQIGNAVPPLLAEVWGRALYRMNRQVEKG